MNAFLELADQQMTRPRKAQLRAAERRSAKRAANKDDDRQAARRRRWHAQRVEAFLARGTEARALVAFLATITMTEATALIEMVKPWRQADADTRFLVLGLVDTAIVGLRERNRMPPFDDPLPGNPPSAFQIIRTLLMES